VNPVQGSDFQRQALSVAATAVLASALLFIGGRHAPWFDEAQAWLIARDNTLWNMFRAMGYEGTPALWHFILWIAIRCGLPFSRLYLISGIAACIGCWIVVQKAPFPTWARLGVVFSSFFAYQYATVARSYALDLILIPLAASLYPDRLKRPLAYCTVLGLLANTNAHSFLIAGVLFAGFLWDGFAADRLRSARLRRAIALFMVLAATAVLQAWRSPDVILANTQSSWRTIANQIGEAVLDRPDIFSSEPPSAMARVAGVVLSGAVLAALALVLLRAKNGLIFIGIVSILLLFSSLVYGNRWHAGLIFLVCVFCVWISWDRIDIMLQWQKRSILAGAIIVIAVHFWYTLASWRHELASPYSAGRVAAAVLKDYFRVNGATPVAGTGVKAFAVQPWFSRNVFANYYNGAPSPAYYDWRKTQSYHHRAELDDWRKLVREQKYGVLVLSDYFKSGDPGLRDFIGEAEQFGYCVLKFVSGGMIWKSYIADPDNLIIFDHCTSHQSR
jgi:hypothetical protein